MWVRFLILIVIFDSFDTTTSEMMMNYYESTNDFVKALEEASELYQNTKDLFYLKKMVLYSRQLGRSADLVRWGFEYLEKEFDHDVFFAITGMVRGAQDVLRLHSLIERYSEQSDSLCFYRGYLSYLIGDYEEAFSYFERSKPYFLNLPIFVSSYLDLLYKLRKTNLLKAFLDSIRTELPQLQYLRGLYYKLLGESDLAILIFRRLHEKGFGDIGFLRVYMQSLDEAGRFEEADSVCVELLRRMPFSWDIRKLIGIHYLTKGDYSSAFSEFLVALGLQKGDHEIHYYLSRVLYGLGAPQDALREIEMAIRLSPYFKEYFYYRIFLLLSLNRLDEALKEIYITEKKFGEEGYLYYLKAGALRRKDDRKNAFKNYLKALELDSLNLKRYLDLLEYAQIARINLDFKDYLSRALRVSKGRVDSLSVAYFAMDVKEYEFAVKIMESILDAGYEDALLYNNLAYAICELGRDLDRALSLVERSLVEQPDDYHFIDTKAWILFKMGRVDESLKLIEDAIQKGGAADSEIMNHYRLIKEAKGLNNE